eukprot:Gregarina_sp_Pseudo_9__2202@NODE_2545_length_961_cov_32_298265_g2335_i0_p1_GENE_NODE_2545_length_961_cov_32_298265_g2335_i0NODE_2545_length_961_cov_32_298265_g2335_i0_p1_ORF_typecomplete_len294_score37_48AAA_13/PF13166_6/0_63NPV_P10/PF05531_12/1_5e04NPV_P10/PF05531_12/2_8NPV_P10/PF05531_12/37Sipho_Gp157/PF05565_11/1_6e02Sipho_Gp157/PF05565_11/1_3_NODE_2545_length_961_cov_32_298265_g2335_i017898
MRGGQARILSAGGGPPPRFGLAPRLAPQPKNRARSQGRLRPAPVEKPSDELPSLDAMLEALRVPAISPNVSYVDTPPLVKRRLEDELVVNHRALLQSGLKCQQDWKLDSQALNNMTQLASSIIVRQLHGDGSQEDEESLDQLSASVSLASAELQKAVIDQCITVARDLDALVSMADAVDACEGTLEKQTIRLGLLRQEIEAKQKVRADLQICDTEAESVLAKEPLAVVDEKCRLEEQKVTDLSQELERRKETHEERIRDFMDIKGSLQNLLESLKNTSNQLTQQQGGNNKDAH